MVRQLPARPGRPVLTEIQKLEKAFFPAAHLDRADLDARHAQDMPDKRPRFKRVLDDLKAKEVPVKVKGLVHIIHDEPRVPQFNDNIIPPLQ